MTLVRIRDATSRFRTEPGPLSPPSKGMPGQSVNIPDNDRKKLHKLLAAKISEMQETSLNPADKTIEEDMEVAPRLTKKTALDSILGEEFACANPPNHTKKAHSHFTRTGPP
ncbi:hypothetical protein CAPTEDRAFT_210016 [Capitella teleta]|uniref:Uncharacterized protein n=1 Tax=Capitella teleta TaxID=283909 RepID=R7VGH6_CAPTE|nr:hypothetical protein CAPTEDRAFT_210016 [Capitella teleta]|eukprot:ELU14790.1 hypothetical protein CAPTEDRAFT_210016 [Capitella teleta]